MHGFKILYVYFFIFPKSLTAFDLILMVVKFIVYWKVIKFFLVLRKKYCNKVTLCATSTNFHFDLAVEVQPRKAIRYRLNGYRLSKNLVRRIRRPVTAMRLKRIWFHRFFFEHTSNHRNTRAFAVVRLCIYWKCEMIKLNSVLRDYPLTMEMRYLRLGIAEHRNRTHMNKQRLVYVLKPVVHHQLL